MTPLIRRILREQERPLSNSILIAEPDAAIAKIMADALAASYQVKIAENGYQVKALCKKSPPSLLILNTILPDTTGLQLFQTVSHLRLIYQIPVILMAPDYAPFENRIAALGAGVDDYIQKPFDVDELVYRIKNILFHPSRIIDPVTRLPRWPTVAMRLDDKLRHPATAATFVLFSVQHLRVYREKYGLIARNRLLNGMARIVETAVDDYGLPQDFIGYLGEGEFALITEHLQIAPLLQTIQPRFYELCQTLYNPPELVQRYVLRADGRLGSLMTLLHSVLPLAQVQTHNSIEIVALAEQNLSADALC